MSKIWFTADTHFGSERTLHLSKRPYKNVEEMNKDMVQKWNEVVDDPDIVYHLGDFGNSEWVTKLTGSIFLLPGNYDTPEVLEELSLHPNLYNLQAEKRLPPLRFPKSFKLPKLHLVHEPLKATSPSAFYLFGHIHKLQMVKRNGLNVGVDCHNFYPIDLDTVKFYYNAITHHYDMNVFTSWLGRDGF